MKSTTIFDLDEKTPYESNPDSAMKSLFEVMKELYASEINCGVESFWDGGFTIWIGNATDLNGMRNPTVASETFDVEELFPEGAQWLTDKAIEHYPDSAFAKKWSV